MSQGTSAPDNGMYAWPEYNQQNRFHQNSYSAHAKPQEQVSSLPIQQYNSTGALDHSHAQYNTYSADPSYDYDQLTPGDSVEDTIPTPEIQGVYWPDAYNLPAEQLLNNNYNNHVPENSNFNSYTDQLRSARNSLPSPESTNVATPDASGHSQKPSMNSTIFTSPLSTPIEMKRPLASINTAMPGIPDPQAHLQTSAAASSLITSPTIHISRHSRGDSPARSDFPRLGKKRSASNLSQGEYFPEVSSINNSGMLAPPNQERSQQSTNDDQDEELRSGIDPAQRDGEEGPSLEDIEQQQEHERSVSEVESWLQHTTLNPSTGERRSSRALSKSDRVRSRSTGARPHVARSPIFAAQQIPGPGRMIDEHSDYHYSTGSEFSFTPDEPLAHPETLSVPVPTRQTVEVKPEEQEPLPKQFFRPRPWQDPFLTRGPDNSIRYQPETSSAAIYEFMKRAKDYDTASRAATWGTSRRRLSDGDKESLNFEGLKTRHLSLSQRTRERGSSILHKVQENVKEQLMKRSNSHIKRQQYQLHEHPELEHVQSPEAIEERSSSESLHKGRQSYSRPTLSPSISAGLLGATNSLAAVGSHGMAIEADHHESLIRRTIRRVRSRSDVNKSPKSPQGSIGFTSMLAQQGGMPVPSLASPTQEVPHASPVQPPPRSTPKSSTVPVESKAQLESPVKMDLSPQATQILPTLDGFKMQIVELNPRLEPYLVDRIAHDQIKRYKRLVKNKVDHLAVVAANRCPSGELCFALGGEAEVLPIRSTGQNAASASAQFKVAPGADSDNEDSAFDGIVTPAAFPEGIPLPPTKKLPARFECPLCFQVKSFQKPSDWTKHVHEDVQPFTCTFPNCPEPKSFKRKADWVRHENERHRHLEWWSCNIGDCTHKCYRKDNFVQHLVREHKRKEPRVKGRGNGSQKGKGRTSISGFNHEEQEFWNLVDACRHEGTNDAKLEPCKFCNNPCASWKKLSVHVGKHMEQLAMPVLDLAKRRNVTKDTIISPVEPLPNRGIPYLSPEQEMAHAMYTAVSPHTQSGTSNYQSSSASHSPRGVGMLPNQALFRPTYVMNGMRQGSMNAGTYGHTGFPSATAYTNFMASENLAAYSSYPGQQVIYAQTPLGPDQFVPRMTGMDGNFISLNSAFDSSPHQAFYSSPEMEHQVFPYGPNMMAMNGNLSVPGQQVIAPVTGHGMAGNIFVYSAQQGNPQQQYSPY